MRINNVFDRYDVTDSTKSMERSRRVTNAMGLEVKIRNPSKPLPRQLDKYTFVNPKNKTALITFICNHLVDKASSSLQPGNLVYKIVTKLCMYVQGGNISLIRNLTCNHEDADTRMLLHAFSCSWYVS